jgi:hypothetical protein
MNEKTSEEIRVNIQNELTREWVKVIKNYRHENVTVEEVAMLLNLNVPQARALLGSFDIMFNEVCNGKS